MSRTLRTLVVPVFSLSVTFASAALADDETDRPLCDERQTWLLERFGDQGIDADADGTLTRVEVRAFFADQRGDGFRGKQGKHGMKGCGHRGMRGRDPGPKGRVGGLLHRLETLNAETPPAEFDLARFPEADLDGNSELSESEWTTFAEQARERILARLARHVPGADADEDGAISAEELAALRAEFRERFLSRHADADTDGDGVLSDAEFEAFKAQRAAERRARILEHHPEADLDGDGTLSEEEARKFRGDRPGHGGARGGFHHRGGKPHCNGAKER